MYQDGHTHSNNRVKLILGQDKYMATEGYERPVTVFNLSAKIPVARDYLEKKSHNDDFIILWNYQSLY